MNPLPWYALRGKEGGIMRYFYGGVQADFPIHRLFFGQTVPPPTPALRTRPPTSLLE